MHFSRQIYSEIKTFWITDTWKREREREKHVVRECLFLMLNYYCVKLVPRLFVPRSSTSREPRRAHQSWISEKKFLNTISSDASVQHQTRNKNVVTQTYLFLRKEKIAHVRSQSRACARTHHILSKEKRGLALCLLSRRGARNNPKLDHPVCPPVCLLAHLFVSFADFLSCCAETRKLSVRIDGNRTLAAYTEATNYSPHRSFSARPLSPFSISPIIL